MSSPLRITFLGGASEIGASSALVQVAGTSLLVDAGVRFRVGQALPDLDALTGTSLDAIVVTHAHTDHTGALPVVHDAFRAAPIVMTPPTRDLVGVLQRDALRIMSAATEREDDFPLYSERQVASMVERIRTVHHGESLDVGEVTVTYLPASHILGASMVHLRTPAGNVLFTGDYSVTEQRSVPRLVRPQMPVDLVVSEATYGNRLHSDRAAAEARLVRTIGEVLERQGRVLIPAFAIGRAQEVLLILKDALRRGLIPKVPVFVDGMVRAVCGVYAQHAQYVTKEFARDLRSAGHPFFTDSIQPVKSPKDRSSVLTAGPCVIVASSGMLRGGPSAFYAADLAPRADDAILITGYQDEESPGRALLKLAEERGPRSLRINDRVVDVRCRFETYSLSAHADRSQMMGLLETLEADTVVLVHGDADAKDSLARSLAAREIVIADDGMSIERAYARRATTTRKPLEALLRPNIAAALVGTGTDAPIDVRPLAASWFGGPVDARTIERFVEMLELARAVRRDPSDRHVVWSLITALAPSEANAEDDPELVEALKAENPKGRLMELCARRRMGAPKLDVSRDGARHVVDMRLQDGTKEFRSGPQRASSRKVAEQLAARALLAQFGTNAEVSSAALVDDDEDAHLRASNPKGRLLELCAQRKLAAPVFTIAATVNGFEGRARVELSSGRAFESASRIAKQARSVEQATAADLLGQLGMHLHVRSSAASTNSPVAPIGGGKNPRAVLNELQQAGRLHGFGIELVRHEGPAHKPTFAFQGWALRDGKRLETDIVEASSKKDGTDAAAACLVAMIERGSEAT